MNRPKVQVNINEITPNIFKENLKIAQTYYEKKMKLPFTNVDAMSAIALTLHLMNDKKPLIQIPKKYHNKDGNPEFVDVSYRDRVRYKVPIENVCTHLWSNSFMPSFEEITAIFGKEPSQDGRWFYWSHWLCHESNGFNAKKCQRDLIMKLANYEEPQLRDSFDESIDIEGDEWWAQLDICDIGPTSRAYRVQENPRFKAALAQHFEECPDRKALYLAAGNSL